MAFLYTYHPLPVRAQHTYRSLQTRASTTITFLPTYLTSRFWVSCVHRYVALACGWLWVSLEQLPPDCDQGLAVLVTPRGSFAQRQGCSPCHLPTYVLSILLYYGLYYIILYYIKTLYYHSLAERGRENHNHDDKEVGTKCQSRHFRRTRGFV